jgi:hypothetical protein
MAAVNTDVVASASVKNGRLIIRNRRAFDQQIAQFRDGAEVEIEVTIRRSTRSHQQNRYYWGVVVHLISDHTGYTADEVHEFLKMKFIPKRLAICNDNGEIRDEFVIGGSTRKMNTIQFGEFMEECRRFAAESLDCVIPDPESAGL